MDYQDIMRMRQSARSESDDEWFDEYYIANCLGSQHLIKYLAPADGPWTGLSGVDIAVKRARNRTGVPKDAVTWVHTFRTQAQNSLHSFTVQVRSVWRDGELLRPLKVHTRVVRVTPDNEDARRSYNAWLRHLDVI